MRFIDKREVGKTTTRRFFAILPVTIGNETRWLETVKVRGYYWRGAYSGDLYWKNLTFED